MINFRSLDSRYSLTDYTDNTLSHLQYIERVICFELKECIPVGCVPAAHWPYTGACFFGGCLLLGGVCSQGVSASGGGGCLLQGGACSWGCLLWGGMSALGGCLLPGGVCYGGWDVCSGGSAPGGWCLLRESVCSRGVSALGGGVWYPNMHWDRHPPPRVDRITDACKNITLATTSLRPVKISVALYRNGYGLNHSINRLRLGL